MKVLLLPLMLLSLTHVLVADEFICPVLCDCPDQTTVNCLDGFYLTSIPRLPPSVRSVAIVNGNMKTLPANAFSSDPKLNRIRISGFLDNIHPNAFNNMSNLTSLNLRSTKIIYLNPVMFKPLSNLTFLMFHLSPMKNISLEGICYMKNLTHLDLRNNKLDSISFVPCMESLKRLSTVQLAGNPLTNISGDSFKGLANGSIRELYLANCKLGNLDSNFFQYLRSLGKLDLSGNKMTTLSPTLFKGMKYLRYLLLSNNHFKGVPEIALKPLTHMKEFYFQHNKLTDLNGLKIFQNLTTLRLLSLDKNPLKKLINDSFYYVKSQPIDRLYLRSCSLREIEPNVLATFYNLTEIIIADNPLTEKPLNNLFRGLPPHQITTLTLSKLRLSNLNNSSFIAINGTPITTLTLDAALALDSSRITTVGSATFMNFPNLKSLSLQHNKISYLEPDSLSGMHQLEGLSLSDNKLLHIPSVKSTGLSRNLKKLYLRQNKIDKIEQNSLKHYDKLEILNLGVNGLKSIDKYAFSNVPQLKLLNLRHNSIPSLKKDEFHPLINLEELYLTSNGIQYFTKSAFSMLKSLKTLDLQGNSKLYIEIGKNPTIFHNLTSLTVLHLQDCGLSVLPPILFSNLKQLQTLYLNKNKISSWNPSTFHHLNELKVLRMSENSIVTLNRTSFPHFVGLRILDLARNPFACTCDIVWLRPWLANNNIYLQSLGKKNSYMCAAPANLKNTPLINFNKTEYDCIEKTWIWVTVSVSLMVITIMAVTTVLYRYRWYIRYYIYLARYRKKNYNELCEAEFEFDAFICYNSDDRHWVINNLLPELEYRRGLKLCLHHRNWLAGVDIEDNIIDSVENSRRTILVLSNRFLSSHWCQLEMTMAQHKLFETNRDSVILLLFETIKPRYLNNRLRSLLTTKTYIEWPKDGEDNDIQEFWKTLADSVLQRRGDNIPLNDI